MPLQTLGQINPDDSLLIFNRFKVDRTLPKHAEAEKAERMALKGEGIEMKMSSDSEDFMVFGEATVQQPSKVKGWFARFLCWFTPTKAKPKPVTEVFACIKASASELAEWDERNVDLAEMTERAQTAGQKDLVKMLEAQKNVRFFENALYAKGRKRLLTERQLLDFTAKCEKGLCLDWVKDFVRPIPPEIVAEKKACDEDHLFDNYVVLHYDPNHRATTPEAREKARDPILFGLIKGSRKLYFVGDWMDDQCDLTFQQIIDKLDSPLEMSASQTV